MERRDKVKKIRIDYEAARHKGKDRDEAIIYSVEQNPDCTSQEFFNAVYPLHSLSLPVDRPEKQKKLFGSVLYLGGKELWRIDKHRIAADTIRFPDHRIIAVRRKIREIDGTVRTFMAQAFAQGQDALDAIPRRRKVMKGIENEIADYQLKGHDQNLQRRLAAEKRRRARQIGGS